MAFAAYSEPARLVVFAFGRWARRRLGRCDRTIVVGAGKVGVDLVRTMRDYPEFGLRPVGFVDLEPGLDPAALPAPLLDEELSAAIVRHRVGTVVLAFSHARDSPVVDAAIAAHRLGCTTLVVPRMFELYHDGPDIERLRSYPLMRLSTAPTSRPSWWVKRFLDVVLAAVALAVLWPVIAVCALAVLVESGRPVIFRQVRVGMNDRTFEIYKIRSVRQAPARVRKPPGRATSTRCGTPSRRDRNRSCPGHRQHRAAHDVRRLRGPLVRRRGPRSRSDGRTAHRYREPRRRRRGATRPGRGGAGVRQRPRPARCHHRRSGR